MPTSELLDRLEMVDVLNRYAQAVDRRNWAVARRAFHDDATVDYGAYRGDVNGLLDYVATRHEALEQSMHFMGQSVVDQSGTVANVTTPVLLMQRRKIESSGPVAMFGDAAPKGEERAILEVGCRYLDRMENRGSGWKITVRTIVWEWMRPTVSDVRTLMQPDWKLATRDPSDPFFQFDASLTKVPA